MRLSHVKYLKIVDALNFIMSLVISNKKSIYLKVPLGYFINSKVYREINNRLASNIAFPLILKTKDKTFFFLKVLMFPLNYSLYITPSLTIFLDNLETKLAIY